MKFGLLQFLACVWPFYPQGTKCPWPGHPTVGQPSSPACTFMCCHITEISTVTLGINETKKGYQNCVKLNGWVECIRDCRLQDQNLIHGMPLPCTVVQVIDTSLYPDGQVWWGATVAEWWSSWLAEQEVRGSIPRLATWISEIGYLLLPSHDLAEILLKRHNSSIQPTKFCEAQQIKYI